MALRAVRQVLFWERGKHFFFEKKKQKTFDSPSFLWRQEELKNQMFFGSFFQKRTLLLFSATYFRP